MMLCIRIINNLPFTKTDLKGEAKQITFETTQKITSVLTNS